MTSMHPTWGNLAALALATATAATLAPRAATAGDSHAGSSEVGLFLGYDLFSEDNELGNSAYKDRRPGDAFLLGGRYGYNLTEMFAVEGELKYALSSYTGTGNPAGVLGLRALALAHLTFGEIRPFAAIGYGAEILVQDDKGTEKDADAALHLGVGVKYHVTREVLLRGDLRYLNIAGSDDLTSDNFELQLGVSYRFGGAPADSDQDGIPDETDKCPNKPEDKDGWQDRDGCPDPDNDGDGVLDSADKCKNDAEDKDGFEDDDGCPDSDNDGDKIADVKDKCPNKAEDKDGFKDDDGCPDPDNDGDGVADVDDKCPKTFGVKEEKGCPIKDQDKDGIPDKKDKCPTKPETFNGVKDDDGCPDGKDTVVITKTEIKILQKVYFETGKADIKPKSFKLLDTVAYVLSKQPRITKIIVEGHTDDVGRAAFNKELSQKRAESVVRYFTDKGIAPSRLAAMGWGPDKPVCTDVDKYKKSRRLRRKLKACREQNRRVQFRIGAVDGKEVEAGGAVTIETKKIIKAK